MEKAAFKFESYQFVKASLNFEIPDDATLEIDINPKGTLFLTRSLYKLEFNVTVICSETNKEVVNVSCVSEFLFDSPISKDDIPDFFYPNSLAIVFPYVRAFVSTISLQANVRPVILPTVNLMGLTDLLRKNTEVSE